MKRFFVWLGILSIGVIVWDRLLLVPHDERTVFLSPVKSVTLIISGKRFEFSRVQAETVGTFLTDQGFPQKAGEFVMPERSEKLLVGTSIVFEPAREIQLIVDGRTELLSTSEKTVEEILHQASIALDEDDMVSPLREAAVSEGTKLQVTRVVIQEETKDTDIAYTTKIIEDEDLSWRKKEVRQKGKKGLTRTVYRVSYHDGKEMNRKKLRTEIVDQPVEEIVVQGVYVKTGKAHEGAASWYAYTGTMAAANPWLPKGSYVRVTNLDNGKSVIVVINDRGPFVPGRIIDLDKVAFQKIASIGAGVIRVKMEEILN